MLEPMKRPSIEIYTDGACAPNPGIGGWGAVLISPAHDGYRKELSGAQAQATNNQMELMAVIEALKALKFPCRVQLYTDSKYIQQAFQKKWVENWQKNGWIGKNRQPIANQDLWKQLIALSQPHEIAWLWVKGHSDHQENDRCDFLAVQAREALAKKLAHAAQ